MGFSVQLHVNSIKAVSVVAKVATKAYEAAKQVVGKAVGFKIITGGTSTGICSRTASIMY